MNEPWHVVKEIVADALEVPTSERAEWLKERCAGNHALVHQVESLLMAQKHHTPAIFQIPAAEASTVEIRNALFEQSRFDIERPALGRGSFGTVYGAFDRERNEHIAIKQLDDPTPDRIARFRTEFRIVEPIRHPNLVRLHELFSNDRISFFTMERVYGKSFIDHVRHTPSMGGDTRRLLPALEQLCVALLVLHHRNIIHRDIKPENILVSEAGVVVILDFGLASVLTESLALRSIAGTPVYMAPEQFDGRPVCASDWFSTGVVLYRALTGTFPWTVEDRSGGYVPVPLAPAQRCSGVSKEISDLCLDLLAADAARRPSGDEVLSRVHALSAARDKSPTVRAANSSTEIFIGRQHELDRLNHLLKESLKGTPVVANIRGCSGVGKSTLVQRFLSQVKTDHPDPVILLGKCHPSETVHYKALDAVILSLSTYLRSLSQYELQTILPHDAACARLFPVLQRVTALAALLSEHQLTDAVDRRRGFQSLIDLLCRLASRRRPIIIAIDDLQWGDLDSAVLLTQLITNDAPPSVLLITSSRIEDTSDFLTALSKNFAGAVPVFRIENITLSELNHNEALAMARRRLPFSKEREREAITVESAGIPFFIDQYARLRESSNRASQTESITLRALVEERIASLPPGGQTLLRIIALAAHPVPDSVAKEAAGIENYLSTRDLLCAEGMLRFSEAQDGPLLDCFHDKIRDIVQATTSELDKRLIHGRLARSFEGYSPADPAVMALHLEHAGMFAEAVERAVEAGDRSCSALAFDRAVELYMICLKILMVARPAIKITPFAVRKRLGNAYALHGREIRAATAFIDAAAEASTQRERIDCKRLAAEQYLRSGHIKEALDILKELADSVGIRLTSKPWHAIAQWIIHRGLLRLRWRRLEFRERKASEIPLESLMRVDIYWSLVVGFTMVDPVLSAVFHARHLRMALRLGEPYRIGLSLALEVGHAVVVGERAFAYAQHVTDLCNAIGKRINSAHVRGLAAVTGAASGNLTGRWQIAIDQGRKAVDILTNECSGTAWEIATARSFLYGALVWTGQWRELPQAFWNGRQDADQKGDVNVYTLTTLLSGVIFGILAADKPDVGRAEITHALSEWVKMTDRRFDVQHLFAAVALSDVNLYSGRADLAWSEFCQEWHLIKRFIALLRSDLLAVLAWQQYGRCAAAAAAVSAEPMQRAKLFGEVRRAANRIRSRRTAWASGLAAMLEAFAAYDESDPSSALSLLAHSEAALERAQLCGFAKAVEWVRGAMTGGEHGLACMRSAEMFMRQQGVVRPDRIAKMLVPGFGFSSGVVPSHPLS